ncbi:hypothetical protein LX32DRAFT_707722 [Colletotrichum zoysiae]|uniref:Uncharacterized protein n=1 Tax=Colletotrichum zoysiae TaxID=1216348 RepID=A0AAD9LW76_9PEZI|nr:hypothetical protein LX32DRAFT_707722 [Colletotrichum zoysiae]
MLGVLILIALFPLSSFCHTRELALAPAEPRTDQVGSGLVDPRAAAVYGIAECFQRFGMAGVMGSSGSLLFVTAKLNEIESSIFNGLQTTICKDSPLEDDDLIHDLFSFLFDAGYHSAWTSTDIILAIFVWLTDMTVVMAMRLFTPPPTLVDELRS